MLSLSPPSDNVKCFLSFDFYCHVAGVVAYTALVSQDQEMQLNTKVGSRILVYLKDLLRASQIQVTVSLKPCKKSHHS